MYASSDATRGLTVDPYEVHSQSRISAKQDKVNCTCFTPLKGSDWERTYRPARFDWDGGGHAISLHAISGWFHATLVKVQNDNPTGSNRRFQINTNSYSCFHATVAVVGVLTVFHPNAHRARSMASYESMVV